MWASPEAAVALRSRDLAAILRVYRRLNRLSQERLADLLGYDKTYVSMIETRRRTVGDVRTRRHIARTLGLPAHVLGVTDGDDLAATVQSGDSIVRLAEHARKAGHAVVAVNELWPLVARLETHTVEGLLERDALILLGHSRAALGVSLGTVLPEERLTAAAVWTSKTLQIAERLGDTAFLAHALRMHGNELRKAGRRLAAIARLSRAVELSGDRHGRGTAFALLARAAGEYGYTDLFDHAIDRYRQLVDSAPSDGMLTNPFSFREILLRGLVRTGRAAEAVRIMETGLGATRPAAPQWHVIERVTAGEVFLAAGRQDSAGDALREAMTAAESHRLPHQIQRGIRAAHTGGLPDVREEGHAALRRLTHRLAPA